MSAGNFAASLAAVLVSEGGYVHDRHDPGGATNFGVTQREYDAWRARHGLAARDVRQISTDERTAIYREDYWNKVHGDQLPPGIDYCLFDFAVNSGPFEADVCLQRALHALQRAAEVTVDGVIGPKTLAAVAAADPREIIDHLCDERLAFMQSHCDWADFGRGWAARVAEVRGDAQGMIAC